MTFLALIFNLPIIGAMIEAGPGSPPNTLTLTKKINEEFKSGLRGYVYLFSLRQPLFNLREF